MTALLPPHRPLQPREKTAQMLLELGVREAVCVLAVRGYFLASMGQAAANDRNIYDDALIICSPVCHAAFNGNTDPSIFRPRVASLFPGVWLYKPGIHGLSKPKAKRYPAFVQAADVTVQRDGGVAESGRFGINIHRGSNTGTSSLGCQTIPPAQWDSFRTLLNEQLARFGQKTFPYALTLDARLQPR